MNLVELQSLANQYSIWLKDKTILRVINEHGEITTPFLDRHNDHIQIYVKKQNSGYVLTDDGYTIKDLETSGCEINTDKRKAILMQTINGFGVKNLNAELCIKTDEAHFPQMKHNLIQAILAVNDIFYTASSVVASLFLEDVQAWLDEYEIRYTPKVNFTGKSGFQHNYDFVIPKSTKSPERIVKAMNNPDKPQIQNLIFSWQDTQQIRPDNSILYAILNDTNPLNNSVLDALINYAVDPLLWSNRDQHLEKLKA
ncbi:MAG: DUF1828 domain-containing protein [Clostridia bacterium]|jgi:hypothetical protein|nr:DUF1828 domain-containing protein [Clostridia bacterium]